MNSLQRQGRIGTYASLAGQEGSQFGTMYAVEDTDWLVYQYREHGTVIDRGSLAEYVRYWMGHEAGNAAIVDHNVAPSTSPSAPRSRTPPASPGPRNSRVTTTPSSVTSATVPPRRPTSTRA
jgi:pyruvate dehydrogenase E1 component alpha subunit